MDRPNDRAGALVYRDDRNAAECVCRQLVRKPLNVAIDRVTDESQKVPPRAHPRRESRCPQKEAAFRSMVEDLALELRQIFRQRAEYQIDAGHALYCEGDFGQLRLAVKGNQNVLGLFARVEMPKSPRHRSEE